MNGNDNKISINSNVDRKKKEYLFELLIEARFFHLAGLQMIIQDRPSMYVVPAISENKIIKYIVEFTSKRN